MNFLLKILQINGENYLMRTSNYLRYFLFFFILVIYSNIPSYYATLGSSLINPRNLFFLLFLYTLIMIFYKKNLTILNKPLFYWIYFYFSLVLLYYIVNNHLEVDEFRKHIFSLVFLICLFTIISYDTNLTLTKKAIFIITLVAIFNNIYEFINPYSFYSELSGIKNSIGRSAGFYINANISGEAIVLGLLFSYFTVPKKFRFLFLIACFLGILLTFSRTALLGYFLVTLFLLKNEQINRVYILILVSTLIIFIIITIPFIEDLIQIYFPNNSNNLINRLNFFSGNAGVDFSQKERTEVAIAAFNLFADNLPFGAGLGVTEHWEHRVSAHNMYLTFMAQFGILGIFMYPALIFAASYNAYKSNYPLAKPFIIYMLIIGFTTHNVLDAYHMLTAIALISNMGYGERNV